MRREAYGRQGLWDLQGLLRRGQGPCPVLRRRCFAPVPLLRMMQQLVLQRSSQQSLQDRGCVRRGANY